MPIWIFLHTEYNMLDMQLKTSNSVVCDLSHIWCHFKNKINLLLFLIRIVLNFISFFYGNCVASTILRKFIIIIISIFNVTWCACLYLNCKCKFVSKKSNSINQLKINETNYFRHHILSLQFNFDSDCFDFNHID